MKEKNSTNFVIGFILGALICLVVWYWQKSTAADEGALDLLDRMAELDRKLRGGETAVPVESSRVISSKSDALQQVKGIGPVFDGRLQVEGITTIAQVAAMPATKLADLLGISEIRAKNILTEASKTL